jgi:hypothetical protein
MKAKNATIHRNRNHQSHEPLPHELGRHLFAMIRRNLTSRQQAPAPQPAQLTFAF